VKLLAKQHVETERWLVEHQQSRVNGHDQSKVQLGHHAFRQALDLAVKADARSCEKTFSLGAIESRMHSGNEVECLRNPNPARQYGDVSNEADIAHEQIALFPGIASKHPQVSLIRNEPEHRVERRGLACAIGTDDSEDAALLDAEINSVERDGCAERLAQEACFNACHSNQRSSFSSDLFPDFDGLEPFSKSFASRPRR